MSSVAAPSFLDHTLLSSIAFSSTCAGAAMGFSYAQTRNLLTPITIHAFWNSGVILLLTFLQVHTHTLRHAVKFSMTKNQF